MSEHAHHWLVPSGAAVVTATCKLCGAQREYATGEVVKRWTMPPADPTRLPAAVFRPAGKSTASKRGALKGINKVETRLKLETEVERT